MVLVQHIQEKVYSKTRVPSLSEAKKLRVAISWWSKFDENQQQAFIRIWENGSHDVNDIRKFITAGKKRFGDDVNYLKFGVVQVGDKKYSYSQETGDWYPLTPTTGN